MIVSLLRSWLPLAIVTTILCGLVYAGVHLEMRQSANDEPLRLAYDAVAGLEAGAAPASLAQGRVIDLDRSLSPFVAILDATGKTLASSATLHGQPLAPPLGVLSFAREHGEDRVTWQPEPAIRIALVVLRAPGKQPGFVLAGQSLRETERRAERLTIFVFLAWIVALATSLLATGLLAKRMPR